jgi:class 3 adenylate cyclase
MKRRLAAVLAADVAGYSRLMAGDEEGTLARLKAVRNALVDRKIGQHRGWIVKTTGDGLLVEFASAVDAARCAVEIQSGMAQQNAGVPQDERIEFRIGIHVGDIIIDDNDIFGDGVNIAARLEGIADPGGICISWTEESRLGELTGAKRDALGLEERGIVERLDHGVDHVGGAMVLALFQQFPHLAQIGAHRRLQRGIAFDQGPRDAEGDAFAAHPDLLDGRFTHGRLLVGYV